MIVDAYAHCATTKYLPVEKVLATMDEAGVQRAVLSQHLGNYDNSYLSWVLTQHPDRFAGVCLVNPAQADALSNLRNCRFPGNFRGVRLQADWLDNITFCLAAIDLGMNLLIYAPDGIRHAVPSILNISRACPSAKIVISHLGNPRVIEEHLGDGAELFQLADSPAVYVQLSGLSMFCAFPYAPLREFISQVIERFGPDRLMWGSNFPVCGDAAAYRRDLALVQAGTWNLDHNGARWLLGRTAQGVWFD